MGKLFLFILGLSTLVCSGRAGAAFLNEESPDPRILALRDFANDKLRVNAVKTFAVENSAGTRRSVDLFLVVEVGSGWSQGSASLSDRFMDELQKSSAIFAQCGFSFRKLHIAFASFASAMSQDLVRSDERSPYLPPVELELVKSLPLLERPLVLFTNEGSIHSYNQTALDMRARSQGETLKPLLNTSLMSYRIIGDYNTKFMTQTSYSQVAHELAHIVGNLGHVSTPAPNLMNTFSVENGPQKTRLRREGQAKGPQLTAEQCEAIEKFPLGSRVAD